MDELRSLARVGSLIVVMSLGATTLLYMKAPQIFPAPPVAEETATPRPSSANAEPTIYSGEIPGRTFTLSCVVSGDKDGAPAGFGILSGTPIEVKDGAATAQASEPIGEQASGYRRTGERSYSFRGRYDVARKQLAGAVKITMKARDSGAGGTFQDITYAFEGQLTAVFTSPTRMKGTVTGTGDLEERRAGPASAPADRSLKQVRWEFSAVRSG